MNVKNFKNLFFKNIGTKQTIFKNTFWLVMAEGINKFSKLILIIYIARILGATEYGKFTFALSFVALFSIFSDLGLFSVTIREFSKDREKEKNFSSILSLKILLSLGTLFLIAISSFFITPDPLIQRIIWILGAYIVLDSFSGIIFAFFQARQRMEYESWIKIFGALVTTVAVIFVILSFPSAKNLSYSYLLSSLITLISVLFFFHLKIFPLKISWQGSIWRKFLSMSWPLALSGMFSIVYVSIDSVMMGYWGQVVQIGLYNAAYKIILASLIPISLISQSFFPVLNIAFSKSKEKFQKTWDYQMKIMIFFSIPLAIGGIILAPQIIDFVYDFTFYPSILAFQILVVMASFIYLSNPLEQALIVANEQKRIFWTFLVGVVFNIILNLILIPLYSFYGAALASLLTIILIFFLLLRFTIKFTPIRPLNFSFLFIFSGVVLSATAMYFIISRSSICRFNVLLSILIGVLIYVFCFFIYKTLIGRFLNFIHS